MKDVVSFLSSENFINTVVEKYITSIEENFTVLPLDNGDVSFIDACGNPIGRYDILCFLREAILEIAEEIEESEETDPLDDYVYSIKGMLHDPVPDMNEHIKTSIEDETDVIECLEECEKEFNEENQF